MNITAKICGINDAVAMHTAIDAGAHFVGLVFYPPSPRALEPDAAAALADPVPAGVTKVGLFVDPDDTLLDLEDEGHQRFGDETTTEDAEMPFAVGSGAICVGFHAHGVRLYILAGRLNRKPAKGARFRPGMPGFAQDPSAPVRLRHRRRRPPPWRRMPRRPRPRSRR